MLNFGDKVSVIGSSIKARISFSFSLVSFALPSLCVICKIQVCLFYSLLFCSCVPAPSQYVYVSFFLDSQSCLLTCGLFFNRTPTSFGAGHFDMGSTTVFRYGIVQTAFQCYILWVKLDPQPLVRGAMFQHAHLCLLMDFWYDLSIVVLFVLCYVQHLCLLMEYLLALLLSPSLVSGHKVKALWPMVSPMALPTDTCSSLFMSFLEGIPSLFILIVVSLCKVRGYAN